jgi:hypothetical protein
MADRFKGADPPLPYLPLRAIALDQENDTDAEHGQTAGSHPGIDFGSRITGKSIAAQHQRSNRESPAEGANVSSAYRFRWTYLRDIFNCRVVGGIL